MSGEGSVDLDLRPPLIAAGSAAAFSVLVGILAGVPLGTILLRALIGGLFFGALAFGGILVLRNTAPELFAGADFGGEGGPAAPEPPEMGRAVDIVLGGDDGEDAAGVEDQPIGDAMLEDLESGEPEDEGLSDGGIPGSASIGGAPARDQVRGSAGKTDAAPDGDTDFEDAEQVAESLSQEMEEPARGKKGGKGVAAALPPPGTGLDDLDSLPDLESMSDSFVEELPGEGPKDEGHAERGVASGRGRGGVNDPAVLAQAVRTLIKRDKKG